MISHGFPPSVGANIKVECDGLRRRAEVLGGMREEILQALWIGGLDGGGTLYKYL